MSSPAPYCVEARNLSHASENRIHDDSVARRFGFEGALVPGVEVYAYMSHVAAARWGIDWLEFGTAECRFLKPVYDGSAVTVSATETGGALAITLESRGVTCATGSATLAGEPGDTPVAPRATPVPAHEDRPDANEASLAVGRRMSSSPMHLTRPRLEQYLADLRETEPLYARENLVHPAIALRLSNSALKENVKLGPWIHAASAIRHCGLARADVSLTAHAVVAANYERKGHRFVDLDVVVISDKTGPVAQIRHTVIYQLRSREEVSAGSAS
jgi:hypothetical protein